MSGTCLLPIYLEKISFIMIVVRLMGGLGNQMFQWAYAKRLSEQNGERLYLDLSFLNSEIPGVTKRKYSLGKFPGFSEAEMTRAVVDGRQFVTITDDNAGFVYDEKLNYFLNGYFQNERHFLDSAASIRSAFARPDGLMERFGVTENSVSLHVRRTDYLSSNGFHPVQDVDYYTTALAEVGMYDKLFVFSDDPEWCVQNLPFENMVLVEGNDDVVDMWLMSLCRDNIIANSSFSWWGAWLNENRSKKVVYPKNWFNGQEADIACHSWIGL